MVELLAHLVPCCLGVVHAVMGRRLPAPPPVVLLPSKHDVDLLGFRLTQQIHDMAPEPGLNSTATRLTEGEMVVDAQVLFSVSRKD